MCMPAMLAIPLVTGGLQVAQTVAGYAGEKQAAEDQQKYQNKVYSQTAAIAKENYFRQIDATQLRLQQDTAQASDTAMQNAAAGNQARGNATAAAGEAGVQGNSVQELLDNFSRVEAMNNHALYTNMLWEQQQAHQELLSAQSQAKGEIAQAAPAKVHQPSMLGAALQIGTTALSTYDAYNYRRQRGAYDPTKPNPLF